MKSFSTLPLTVKVGGSAIVGGSGITGAGLLIHNQLQKTSKESNYKLEGLDLELVNDSEAVLGVDSGTEFSIGTDSKTNQATLKIKVTAAKTDSKAKDKWTCTITGVAKDSNTVTLSDSNFDKSEQIKPFTNKLGKDTNKKVSQNGFVTSCARNRGSKPAKNSDWESTLTFNLKQNNQKWVFDDNDIEEVFKGTYTNPGQQ